MVQIELRHLRYFVAVAQERHVGRAAERLGMAQPPLSRQIQQLERRLGTRLFDRTPRGVALTPAGEALLEDAREILARVEAAALRAGRVGSGGAVTAGFVSNLGYRLIPSLAARLRETHPHVTLRLTEAGTPQLAEQLVDGTLDVALLAGPLNDPNLIARRLFDDPLLLALPATHPLARDAEAPLHSLLAEPFVGCPRYPHKGFNELVAGLFERAGYTAPRHVQEADDKRTIVALVAAGVGLAVLPASARGFYDDAREGRDVVFRTLAQVPAVEVSVAWRRQPTSATRAVIDAAVDLAAGSQSPMAYRATRGVTRRRPPEAAARA